MAPVPPTGRTLPWALDGPLASPVAGDDAPKWLFSWLARLAMPVWGAAPGEGRDLLLRVRSYWSVVATIERQHAGVIATARTACVEFASPALARTLYFGCEPGLRTAHAQAVDFGALVSREANGRIVLFQPDRGGLDGLVAKSLKALFFEAALADGRFERRRLAPFTLDAPHVRARSKASAAIEID